MNRSLLIAALLLGFPAHADPIALPELGSSAAGVFSPQQERLLGQELVSRLRHSGAILDEAFISAYVNDLGARLALAQKDSGPGSYHFFVLKDLSINAFALPGGHIGINAGLIVASRSEDELAAVVAHEMAHVSQNHIARSLEQAGQLNAPLTAALLAGILLASQDPQAGQAAIVGSIAGSTQARIDFTRANEQEADRIGMQVLAEAGFDAEGMPRFFERLYQETRLTGAEVSQLEFLRTHPVTISRIADSRSRVPEHRTTPDFAEWSDYPYVKAWLEVHAASHPETLEEQLKQQLASAPSPGNRYALALHLTRSQRLDEARKLIRAYPQEEARRPPVLRLRAQIERADGQLPIARTLLLEGVDLYPSNTALTEDLAQVLIELGAPDEATMHLRAFLQRRPDSARAFQLLAQAESARGHAGAAKLALAEYYYLQGDINLALDQLRTARKEKGVDFYELARIEARMNEIATKQVAP